MSSTAEVACGAIRTDQARLPHAATITSVSAAVDVRFSAVFFMVCALIRHAGERLRIAGITRAIGIGGASLPHGAGRTSAAAAVGIGFLAVFAVVDAL
jgi:hypothetical protein